MNGGDVFTLQKILRQELEDDGEVSAIWGTALREQNKKFNPLNNFDY